MASLFLTLLVGFLIVCALLDVQRNQLYVSYLDVVFPLCFAYFVDFYELGVVKWLLCILYVVLFVIYLSSWVQKLL